MFFFHRSATTFFSVQLKNIFFSKKPPPMKSHGCSNTEPSMTGEDILRDIYHPPLKLCSYLY